MSTTVTERTPLASAVTFSPAEMTVTLVDGRRLTVPLVWFPRLTDASPEQLCKFELLGDGEGIHWPELDEDLSVAGLLR